MLHFFKNSLTLKLVKWCHELPIFTEQLTPVYPGLQIHCRRTAPQDLHWAPFLHGLGEHKFSTTSHLKKLKQHKTHMYSQTLICYTKTRYYSKPTRLVTKMLLTLLMNQRVDVKLKMYKLGVEVSPTIVLPVWISSTRGPWATLFTVENIS